MRTAIRTWSYGSCLAASWLLAGCTDLVFDSPESGESRQHVTCAPAPAPTAFESALCLCEGLDKVGTNLIVHNGSVGLNGAGTFSGSNSLVEGSLRAYGGLSVSGSNVSVGEDVEVGSNLNIDGSANLSVGGTVSAGGTMQLRPGYNVVAYVDAGPPCGCDAATIFDVGGAVAAAKTTANEVEIPSLVGNNGMLTLTAGSYYSEASTLEGSNLGLEIEGSVQLYVNGSLSSLGSNRVISIHDGGALDLYISGTVDAVGSNVVIGSGVNGAQAFRVYIGGVPSETILVGSNGVFNGAIYAPTSAIATTGTNLIVGGALFGKSLDAVGTNITVDYGDPAPDDCVPPGGGGGSGDGDGAGSGGDDGPVT